MTDTTAEPTAPEPAQAPPANEPAPKETDWKAEAKKWESRAKENKTAAERLAEIEEANKSEAQKAADRLAAAEAKAAEAERRAARFEIASEFQLSTEDAKALEHVSSEDGMRAVAERLAAAASDRKKNGNVVPKEGRTPSSSGTDPVRDFARDLFGAADS